MTSLRVGVEKQLRRGIGYLWHFHRFPLNARLDCTYCVITFDFCVISKAASNLYSVPLVIASGHDPQADLASRSAGRSLKAGFPGFLGGRGLQFEGSFVVESFQA